MDKATLKMQIKSANEHIERFLDKPSRGGREGFKRDMETLRKYYRQRDELQAELDKIGG